MSLLPGLSVISFLSLSLCLSVADKPIALFNGKDLNGWEGETEKTWKVEDGADRWRVH